MASKVQFGYWIVRGKGQVSRLLLSFTGIQWEQITYSDVNKWFTYDKFNLGLDFPNLPYLIDGEFKLTQSAAIERYIIQKYGNKELLGKNIQDSAKINQIYSLYLDMKLPIRDLCYDKDYKNNLNQAWQKIKPKFDYLEKFIGDKQWVMGYLTLLDFYIAQFANYFEKVFSQKYNKYPSFERIRKNLNNLDQIKQYYAKQGSIKGPFTSPNHAAIVI